MFAECLRCSCCPTLLKTPGRGTIVPKQESLPESPVQKFPPKLKGKKKKSDHSMYIN